MDRIATILEMLSQHPKDSFLRHALALEYTKKGLRVEAKTLFEEVLSQDPDYVGSYYHLAKLLETLTQTEKAIGCYTAGIAAARRLGDQHALMELEAALQELTD